MEAAAAAAEASRRSRKRKKKLHLSEKGEEKNKKSEIGKSSPELGRPIHRSRKRESSSSDIDIIGETKRKKEKPPLVPKLEEERVSTNCFMLPRSIVFSDVRIETEDLRVPGPWQHTRFVLISLYHSNLKTLY